MDSFSRHGWRENTITIAPKRFAANGRLPTTFWRASARQNVAEAERILARSEARGQQD
jgi:hypothetical protein